MIIEKNKCSELVWVDVNNTKEEFAPNVLKSTQRAIAGESCFSEYDE
jgi:hypothetical protein